MAQCSNAKNRFDWIFSDPYNFHCGKYNVLSKSVLVDNKLLFLFSCMLTIY